MSLPINIDRLSPADEEYILRAAANQVSREYPFKSLEDLVANEEGFGLDAEGTMSNLQKGLCRLIDGKPLGPYARDPKVAEALGMNPEELLKVQFEKPKEMVVLAAVRTAKSLIAAANAIHASQTVEIPQWIKSGEVPRYSIASLELDNAKVVLAHLLGVLEKPALKALRIPKKTEELLMETGAEVIGSVFLYNPQGRIVEIRVVAGKKAGGSLVSRWSIGATLDEAPRMVGSSEAIINYDDSHRAVRSRLLPGAQILSIGSPWQPFGPIYDLFQDCFGYPNEVRIIFRGRGPDMNPVWWTQERCDELRLSKNRNDQMVYQTDVLALFADEEEMLYSQALLAMCIKKGVTVVPPQPRHEYVAAIDPATRGNAWTLVICGRKGRRKRMVYNQEWRGKPNEPLSPRAVIREIAATCKSYGLDWAYTDQWAADHNRDMALEEGFSFVDIDWTEAEKVDTYTSLASAMADGTVELLDDPQVRKDLKMVKKKVTHRGFSIQLPSTTDGRHCDYSPPTARCFKQWIEDEQKETPTPGQPGYAKYYEEKMIAEEELEFERKQDKADNPFYEDIFEPDPWEQWEQQRNLRAAALKISREIH